MKKRERWRYFLFLFLVFCSRVLSPQNNWYSQELSTQAVGLETNIQTRVIRTCLTPPNVSAGRQYRLFYTQHTSHQFSARYFSLFSSLYPSFYLQICFSRLSLLPSLMLSLLGSFDVSSYLLSHTTCSVFSRTGQDWTELGQSKKRLGR